MRLKLKVIRAARSHAKIQALEEPLPPPETWSLWLGEKATESEQLTAVLRPYPANGMTKWPVSARVGDARNNDPSLIEPVELPAA